MCRNGVLWDIGRIFVTPIGRIVNVFPMGEMFLVGMFLGAVND